MQKARIFGYLRKEVDRNEFGDGDKMSSDKREEGKGIFKEEDFISFGANGASNFISCLTAHLKSYSEVEIQAGLSTIISLRIKNGYLPNENLINELLSSDIIKIVINKLFARNQPKDELRVTKGSKKEKGVLNLRGYKKFKIEDEEDLEAEENDTGPNSLQGGVSEVERVEGMAKSNITNIKLSSIIALKQICTIAVKNNKSLLEKRLNRGSLFSRILEAMCYNMKNKIPSKVELATIDVMIILSESLSSEFLNTAFKSKMDLLENLTYIIGILKVYGESAKSYMKNIEQLRFKKNKHGFSDPKKDGKMISDVTRGLLQLVQILAEEEIIAMLLLKSNLHRKIFNLKSLRKIDDLIFIEIFGVFLTLVDHFDPKITKMTYENEQFVQMAKTIFNNSFDTITSKMKPNHTLALINIYKREDPDSEKGEFFSNDFFFKNSLPVKIAKQNQKNFSKEIKSWRIKIIDQTIIAINLARFFETVRKYSKTRDADDSLSPFEPSREKYINPGLIYDMISSISLTDKVMTNLAKLVQVDDKVLPIYSQFCECTLSFIINLLIYCYGFDESKKVVQNFDFQIGQILIIELRNFSSYFFSKYFHGVAGGNAAGKKPKRSEILDVRVVQKILEILEIIMENLSYDGKVGIMRICNLGDWMKIFKIQNMIYKNDIELKIRFVRVLSKIADPEIFRIEEEEDEEAISELTKCLLEIVKKSKDCLEIGNSIETIMDIFYSQKFDVFFLRFGVFKILFEGIEDYKKEIDRIILKLRKHDRVFLRSNYKKLKEFLNVKQAEIELKRGEKKLPDQPEMDKDTQDENGGYMKVES